MSDIEEIVKINCSKKYKSRSYHVLKIFREHFLYLSACNITVVNERLALIKASL